MRFFLFKDIYNKNYKIMGKRILRLNESELTQLIKQVIQEAPMAQGSQKGTGAIIPQDKKCVKPTMKSECTQNPAAKSTGGRVFYANGSVVMMIKGADGCPELCRVGDREIYKLS